MLLCATKIKETAFFSRNFSWKKFSYAQWSSSQRRSFQHLSETHTHRVTHITWSCIHSEWKEFSKTVAYLIQITVWMMQKPELRDLKAVWYCESLWFSPPVYVRGIGYMQNMRAFKTVCPLRNELHLDITTAVKVTANPLVMLNVFDLHINVHTRTYIYIMMHRLQNVVMMELLVSWKKEKEVQITFYVVVNESYQTLTQVNLADVKNSSIVKVLHWKSYISAGIIKKMYLQCRTFVPPPPTAKVITQTLWM